MSEEFPTPKRLRLDLSHRKARVKRGDYYKRMPRKPKFFQEDFRRSFASAFVNTYNSGNFDMIWGFMKHYFQPNFTFEQSWGTSKLVAKQFPPERTVHGLERGIIHWYTRCLLMPDLVVTAKKTTVTIRSDGSTLIEMQYNLTATLLSTVDAYDVIFSDYSSTGGSNKDLYQISKARIESFVANFQNNEPLLTTSPVSYDGMMRMRMNSDNRVYHFQVIMDAQ